MSLEQIISQNTAAVQALTEALMKNGVPAPVAAESAKSSEKNTPKKETTKAAAAEEKAPPAAATPDYETVVKPAVIAFVKKHGRDAIDAFMQGNFKVSSAKDLTTAQYQECLDKLKAADAEADAAADVA